MNTSFIVLLFYSILRMNQNHIYVYIMFFVVEQGMLDVEEFAVGKCLIDCWKKRN